MSDNILKDIEKFLELKNYTDYEFKEVCGLTFAFKREIVTIKGRISSASIAPVGIIYEENGQYYLAPLDEAVNINETVKEYVEKCI
ncbi:hypothetical protein [Methanobrevibacter sp. UBA212]|uniref:hypothetical protein n=1 Tax=Methanobrevibacter sp. UBA212 TaxID=1915476 RepID=UPI0025E86EDA|nr:hypothetical protein [Methanobrevibacter sp. UBA212]MEE1150045.1 hypothetical protein [Methanobrevibacter sp.]